MAITTSLLGVVVQLKALACFCFLAVYGGSNCFEFWVHVKLV